MSLIWNITIISDFFSSLNHLSFIVHETICNSYKKSYKKFLPYPADEIDGIDGRSAMDAIIQIIKAPLRSNLKGTYFTRILSVSCWTPYIFYFISFFFFFYSSFFYFYLFSIFSISIFSQLMSHLLASHIISSINLIVPYYSISTHSIPSHPIPSHPITSHTIPSLKGKLSHSAQRWYDLLSAFVMISTLLLFENSKR